MDSNQEVICKRAGRKSERTWPDGTTSTGYVVGAARLIPGTSMRRNWTVGFAAEVHGFGKRDWVIRHPETGALLVGIADVDRGRDETLGSLLWALERKIARGDIPTPGKGF